MQKLHTFFQKKNINIYAIFNDQSFNNTLTNDIISFEQPGLEVLDEKMSNQELWIYFWELQILF